jgi:hypothetical protein
VNGLWKLDDSTLRKQLKDTLAKILMPAPNVTEVATAMYKDRSGGHHPLKIVGGEIRPSGNIGRPFPMVVLQVCHLAHPYR